MNFHKFYVRAFIIVLLIGPMFWLVFTKDGQRYYDVLMLRLTNGAPQMDLDIARLGPNITEELLRQAYPHVTFACHDRITDLGSRVCETPIIAFNGNPSFHAAFYFGPHGLQALKVSYQRAYHRRLRGQLDTLLGAHGDDGEGALARWKAGYGVVFMLKADRLEPDDEPAMLWLAGNF